MIKEIVNYEQSYLSDGEIPRNYYDPNIMLAERNFCIKPGEEILIVISGNGYRFFDDTIFILETSTHPNNFDSDYKISDSDQYSDENIELLKSEIKSIIPSSFSSKQLCMYLRNTSNQYSIYVGKKSSLTWLLDMPRISSKLCFCSVSELSRLKKLFKLQNETETDFAAENKTICLHG
jgi:hypothetical protein